MQQNKDFLSAVKRPPNGQFNHAATSSNLFSVQHFRPTLTSSPKKVSSGFGEGVQNHQSVTPPALGQKAMFGNATSTFASSPMFGAGASTFGGNTFGRTNASTSMFSRPNLPALGQAQVGFVPSLHGSQPMQTSGNLLGGSMEGLTTNTTYPFRSSSYFGNLQSSNAPFFKSCTTTSSFGNGQFVGSGLVKFEPMRGTDQMQKCGTVHSINTKHQCISLMKEYENRSLEELRWDDYQANRKGPQQKTTFTNTFKMNTPTNAFAPPLPSKPNFGSANGFVGSSWSVPPSGFGLGQNNAPNVFNKPPSSTFGSTFGGFTPTNLEKPNTLVKPFTHQQDQNAFSGNVQQQRQPAFGGASTFERLAQSSTLKPASFQVGMNNVSSMEPSKTTTDFQFGNKANSAALFGQPKTSHQFEQTYPIKPLIPQSQQTFSGFNSVNFAKPQQQTLGATFGISPSIFQSNQMLSCVQPTSNGAAAQPTLCAITPEQSLEDTRVLIRYFDIFGPNSALNGLTPMKASQGHYVTNPKEIQEIMYNDPPKIIKNSHKIRVSPPKINLYSDLLDADRSADDHLFKRTSVKSLKIRKNDTNKMDEEPNWDSFLRNIESSSFLEEATVQSVSDDAIVSKRNPTRDFNGNVLTTKEFLEATKNITEDSSGDLLITKGNKRKEEDEHQNSSDDLPEAESFYTVDDCWDASNETIFFDAIDTPQFSVSLCDTSHQTEATEENANHQTTLRNDDAFSASANATPGTRAQCSQENAVVRNVSVSFSEQSDSTREKFNLADITSTLHDSFEGRHFKKISKDQSCGVVLTHSDYYLIPPLKKLHHYRNEGGRCVVRGLTIGRLGYGNVYFPNDIDVTGMNLDELVQFDHKTIVVYPNDEAKPPRGEGLNTYAQITLDKIYPVNRETQFDIVNPVGTELSDFVEKLRKITKKLGGAFVDYRPETGSWVFTVEHF